jgi:hypothetical protein
MGETICILTEASPKMKTVSPKGLRVGACLPGSLMTCQHLGRNHSEHLPASSRFPFLAGEFNHVAIVGRNSLLEVHRCVAHDPERTILGQGTSSFSILQLFPDSLPLPECSRKTGRSSRVQRAKKQSD